MSDSKPSSGRAAAACLAAALLATAALGGALIGAKRIVRTDEGISYLAATGHQGEYARRTDGRRPPYGEWSTAGEWKRMVRPEPGRSPALVGSDLARHDIHPPLYFWLLHLWLLAGPETPLRWGPALNLPLTLATVLAIAALGRRWLGGARAGALAALLWALSPAALSTALHARPYALLGLAVTLFLLAGDRVLAGSAPAGGGPAPGPISGALRVAALAGATAALLLTHYHGALLIAGAAMTLAPPGRREDRRPGARHRAARWAAAVAAGALLAAALHPGFAESLLRGAAEGRGFEAAELATRLRITARAWAGMVFDTRVLPGALAPLADALLAAAVAAGLGAAALTGLRGRDRESAGALAGGRLTALAVWLVGTNAALYLAGVSPRHAMGSWYLAPVLPVLALLAAAGLRGPEAAGPALGRPAGERVRHAARRALPAALALAALSAAAWRGLQERRLPPVERWAAEADAAVVATVDRLVLPAALLYLPDELPLYAATTGDLLAEPDRWTAGLGRTTLAILHAESASERRETRALRELLDGRTTLTAEAPLLGGRALLERRWRVDWNREAVR